MRVLVTGATGFLGGRLARRLAKEGHYVLCPIRREAQIEGCKTFIEKYEGEFYKDFQGPIDVFFNTIGHISDHLPAEKLRPVNVDMQGELVKAASRLGTKRYIHISSTSAGGLGHKDGPINEEDQLGTGMGYGDTKRDGEKLVLKLCKELGLYCVILRPTAIYGQPKGDILKRVEKVLKTGVRMVGKGSQVWHTVHVDDVVDSCILAAKADGVDSMIFNIAGPDPLTAREVINLACEAIGTTKKGFRLPSGMVNAVAKTCEFIFRKKPPVTTFTAKLLLNSHHFDINKAQKYLGYNPKYYLKDEIKRALGIEK